MAPKAQISKKLALPSTGWTADAVAAHNRREPGSLRILQEYYGHTPDDRLGDVERFSAAREMLSGMIDKELRPLVAPGAKLPSIEFHRPSLRRITRDSWNLSEFRPRYARVARTPRPHWVDYRLFPSSDTLAELQGEESCICAFIKWVWSNGTHGRLVGKKIKSEDGNRSETVGGSAKRSRKLSNGSTPAGKVTRQKLDELNIDEDVEMAEDITRVFIDDVPSTILLFVLKGNVTKCEIFELTRRAIFSDSVCSLQLLRTICWKAWKSSPSSRTGCTAWS